MHSLNVELYSRVPNNRRGWNNRGRGGRGGGLDIVIIINNRRGEGGGGWNKTRLKK